MKKIGRIQQQRGLRMEQQPEEVRTYFLLTPIYVALFFRNIMGDPDAENELRVFANASEQELDSVIRTFVFWWFYALDRIGGNFFLGNINVRTGLRNIWGYSDEQVENLTCAIDAIPREEVATFPWRYICKTLDNKSLSFLAINRHLHNAQMRVLKDPMEAMRG